MLFARGRHSLILPASSGRRASNTVSKKAMSLSDGEGHGVPLADEDTIMAHLDEFCVRVRQILDVINTLTQFNK